MGRPSKLTNEVTNQLVALLQQGHTVEIACTAVGIDDKTFHRWMNKGQKQREGPYRDFFEAIKPARAHAEVQLMDTLQKTALDPTHKSGWKAAAWLLERLFPDRYGRRTAHTIGGMTGGAIEVNGNTPVVKIVLNGNQQPPAAEVDLSNTPDPSAEIDPETDTDP